MRIPHSEWPPRLAAEPSQAVLRVGRRPPINRPDIHSARPPRVSSRIGHNPAAGASSDTPPVAPGGGLAGSAESRRRAVMGVVAIIAPDGRKGVYAVQRVEVPAPPRSARGTQGGAP